jgi:cytochrome o ubiquinol oxidase subunit 1
MLWFMGFLVTFTIGGMTGVMMAIPGIDFQFHNTLFLVAHFHNMIIGGVLFGFFAGLSYWFPKIFGFSLDERIGTWAFWSWIIGFVLAFIPLYVLGLMGMTRRLDHIDASTGWHSLLIVAAIGACIIAFAILLQVLQIVVSVRNRKKLVDSTGDPWNGRTLEWATSSPAALYNFAVIPDAGKRDAFWEMKRDGNVPKLLPKYSDINLPKNTGFGVYIAGFSFLFGFGMIWQIWGLVVVSLFGILASMIARSFETETEYVLSGKEVAQIESLRFTK